MENLGFIICLVIVIAVITICGIVNDRRHKNNILKILSKEYGGPALRQYKDGEYGHISGYYRNHPSDYNVDDITWNDLNLDAVFARMNYTHSSAGEEYLYYMLRSPRYKGDDFENLEAIVSFYMEHDDSRLNLAKMLHDCGYTGKYSIYDYLNNLDVIASMSAKRDKLLLLVYLVGIVAIFISRPVGIIILVLTLMYGGVTYFSVKRSIEPYITSFAYVFRVLDNAMKIATIKDDVIDTEVRQLTELAGSLKNFTRFSYLVMSKNSGTGDVLEILLDYIKMFTHLDIIKFFQMRNEIKKHWDEIDEMLTITGKIDAYLSIAYYRGYVGDKYCVPKFDSTDYIACGLYHPLVEDAVANDVSSDKGILLTGSNASGKSTMLRAIALSAVMAQSIHTVHAENYNAPMYRIYTSLSLADNLVSGDSYYMAEIKALKRIIDKANDLTPVLACVDEVLRGTNTIERISASVAILKQLASANGFMLAATHDLELTELLEGEYSNYHFEEKIENGDITFAYKMLEGPATTRNAIKLLEITGYDSKITEEATRMANAYMQAGN